MFKVKIKAGYELELEYNQFDDVQNVISCLTEGAREPVKFEIEYVREERGLDE